MITKPSQPLVSIVIPTHNRKALLAESIDSCLEQVWNNIELIIVDDGSTDATEEYVQNRIAEHQGKVVLRYERQDNSGASAARNRGLALAQGEYVQFLDSDDVIFRDKLNRQIAFLESAGHGGAAGCSCYGVIGPNPCNPNGRLRIGVRGETPRDYIELLTSKRVHGMQTSAPLWRRSFLVKQAGWRTDISFGDDLEYHVRLLCAAEQFLFVDDILFFVRDHDGPRLSDVNGNRRQVQSSICAFRAIVASLSAAGYWDATTQSNLLKTLRTTYANVLEFGDDSDIRDFEEWLNATAQSPKRNWLYPTVTSLRRLFGARIILRSHRLLKRIRARR